MKATKKQIDDLNIELTLDIVKEDYEGIERKKIAERKRTADFRGFRKGMVPESLIRRVYGDQILAESVNQVISKGLQDFIEENGLNVLGEPLGSENQPEVEWKDGNAFTFLFDIALYPEISVEAGKDDTVTSYNVTVSAKEKSGMKENLKKYYEEQKEEKTDEDLDKEVSERLGAEYRNEAEWKLTSDIRKYFVEKADVKLPEAFLKRWLAVNNEKMEAEELDRQFPGFLEDFRWQLVRGAFMKKYGFKVEQADLEDAARAYVTYQYAMYGMGSVPEEIIRNNAEQMLSDRRELDRLVEQVEDRKVMEQLRKDITISSKRIGSEKFRELK
mgnify:FL=1